MRLFIALLFSLVASSASADVQYELGDSCAEQISREEAAGSRVVHSGRNIGVIGWFQSSPMTSLTLCSEGKISHYSRTVYFAERHHAVQLFHEFRKALDRRFGISAADLSDPSMRSEHEDAVRANGHEPGKSEEGIEYPFVAFWDGAWLAVFNDPSEYGDWSVTQMQFEPADSEPGP